MANLVWRTEKRKVRDLIPWPGNPRRMTDKQAEDLKKSLQKFNLMSIPVVDLGGRIVSGHQRVRILQMLGRGNEEIDVRIPNRQLTEEEFQEANIRENKNLGEWDVDLLASIDHEILLEAGFEKIELDSLFDITLDLPESTEPVPPPEAPPEIPVTKLGDMYLLGNHRLLCGDSTNADHVARLMGATKANMIFTDPPYGMGYGGGRAKDKAGNKVHGDIAGDSLDGNSLLNLLRDSLYLGTKFLADDGAFYICLTWRTYHLFVDALSYCGLVPNSCIVWDKQSIGLGHGDYRPQHEFILYCGGKFYGDRAQSDMWAILRETTGDYVHPTQKPVELVERALANSSIGRELVLDMFGGSGTTLMACQRMGRTCYMMELDPRYCDVIVNRWATFTGDKPTMVKAVE